MKTETEISVAKVEKQNSDTKLNRQTRLLFVALGLILVSAIVLGISFGSTVIAPVVVLKVLIAKIFPLKIIEIGDISEAQQTVIWLIRTPRVLVAALVGASLAIAGAQMQGLFKNPLASPDITGTSAGGSLGAILAIASGLASRSMFYLPILAFFGALTAIFLVYFISTRRGKTPVATLLLAGIALSAMFGAMSSLIISLNFADYRVSQEILFWLMGGLDSRTWDHVLIIAPFAFIGTTISLFYMRELDLMLLGEETAATLGVEIENVKRIILTISALLTGVSVAVAGIIGFVGLIIPHIVRLILGPSHRRLIPASALAGASFLILADLIARTVIRPEEIRLGILTALLGAPFFLYLLMKQHRE